MARWCWKSWDRDLKRSMVRCCSPRPPPPHGRGLHVGVEVEQIQIFDKKRFDCREQDGTAPATISPRKSGKKYFCLFPLSFPGNGSSSRRFSNGVPRGEQPSTFGSRFLNIFASNLQFRLFEIPFLHFSISFFDQKIEFLADFITPTKLFASPRHKSRAITVSETKITIPVV